MHVAILIAELSRARIAQRSTIGKKIGLSMKRKLSVRLYVNPIMLGDVKDLQARSPRHICV